MSIKDLIKNNIWTFIAIDLVITLAVVYFLLNGGFFDNKLNEREIVGYINEIREIEKLQTLEIDRELNQIANQKAIYMVNAGCWGHGCAPNNQPFYFWPENTQFVQKGENLANGFLSEEKLMEGWINSEEHLAGIVNPDFSDIGIAIINDEFLGVSDNNLVVVLFGSEKPENSDKIIREYTVVEKQKFIEIVQN